MQASRSGNHDRSEIAFPQRIIELTVIVTNAAGGLNPVYAVGDIVAINDVRLFVPIPSPESILTK